PPHRRPAAGQTRERASSTSCVNRGESKPHCPARYAVQGRVGWTDLTDETAHTSPPSSPPGSTERDGTADSGGPTPATPKTHRGLGGSALLYYRSYFIAPL